MKQITELLQINLLLKDKYYAKHKQQALNWLERQTGFSYDCHGLKAGDIVTFIGGFNSDIKYTSEIFAFDKYGLVYVCWDCYWFGIDVNKRLVKKINS